jgi:hypothetical protein
MRKTARIATSMPMTFLDLGSLMARKVLEGLEVVLGDTMAAVAVGCGQCW